MTEFSVSLFDSIFGETIEIDLPDPNGKIIKKKVTKRWFDKMKQDGLITEIKEPMVRVHILDPLANGIVTQHWTVGKDVSSDIVARFKDSTTCDMYCLISYKSGQPQYFILQKLLWEEARKAMDEGIPEEQFKKKLRSLIARNENG